MVEIGVRGPCPAGAGVERQPDAQAPTSASAGTCFEDRQQRLAAQAGVVGRRELADRDLLHALEALHHDFHVRLHHGVAQLAEFLHVLLVNDLAELLLRDAELLQHGADGEERAQKCVALHAQLQIGAVGGLARDVEAGQREHANLFLDDLLARPKRQILPRALAFAVRLPDQAAAFLHAVERIGVREGLGVAAENHGHVAQIAVDANALLGRDHKVAGRRAFLLRTVLGIGADVDDFLGIAQFVVQSVALEEQIVQVAENGAEIFAGGDGAPAADGVEAHGDRALGQQRRRLVGDDAVGMVDAQDDEVGAIRGGLAVLARAAGRGVLKGANDVLGAEVARAQAVAAAEKARHFGERDGRQATDALGGFRKCGANVAAQRIVAGKRLVGPLQR